MSPLTMALLGMLAYKAYQKMSAPQPNAAPPATTAGNEAGGLGGLLGGLAGMLGGGAGGSMLNGGLNDLLGRLGQNGLGNVAQSWVGHGENQNISPDDLAKVLDRDTVGSLAEHTGMSENDVLSALSRQLPDAINHITPHGRVPTDHEASQML
jgi:uncharacterized protein YidB (DUF937 family)